MKSGKDKTNLLITVWNAVSLLVILSVPVIISVNLNAWPSMSKLIAGLLPVAVVLYPAAIFSVFLYIPLLGREGAYISFLTGNISNIRLPCALNAMSQLPEDATDEQKECVASISISTSAAVTTAIIAVSVLLFTPILPYFTSRSSPLTPAFQQVLPALFGALGVMCFAKNIRISLSIVSTLLLVLIVKGRIGTSVLMLISTALIFLFAYIEFRCQEKKRKNI